jgi:hypothetical protein
MEEEITEIIKMQENLPVHEEHTLRKHREKICRIKVVTCPSKADISRLWSYHDFMILMSVLTADPPQNSIGQQSHVYQAYCQLLCLQVYHLLLDISDTYSDHYKLVTGLQMMS